MLLRMDFECGREEIRDDIIDRQLRDRGDPLESSVRGFMEARFGVDLRGVRVHTDRSAVEAARRLNAHAFTRGAHIWFGLGQYAPEKAHGRWLIAHELAHVIQQSHRGDIEWGCALPVGDPCSWFETESNLIADEVLRTHRVSPITPDNSGTIRRAITIVPGSGQITLQNSGAKSAVTPTTDGRRMICNLTQGFDADEPEKSGLAFTATGKLNLLTDNKSEVDELNSGAWKFGFIQIAKMHFSGMFWAGTKNSEGSVGMVESASPAWPQNNLVSLDSATDVTPFVSKPNLRINPVPISLATSRSAPGAGRVLVQAAVLMGDHPQNGGPVKATNQKTGAANYLFHITEQCEYFTVLVAINNGVVNPVAYFHWNNNYDAKIKWHGGSPLGVQNGAITFDSPVQGGPTDSAISALVTNPQPPFTKDLHNAAAVTAVKTASLSNFSFNPTWFADVPVDFWT
jgi:hypothetical protein